MKKEEEIKQIIETNIESATEYLNEYVMETEIERKLSITEDHSITS